VEVTEDALKGWRSLQIFFGRQSDAMAGCRVVVGSRVGVGAVLAGCRG
jgi:hypothetical protein